MPRSGGVDPCSQQAGERTHAWSDLDQRIARARVDRMDDRLDHMAVDQEVLAEPASGAVRFQAQVLR
jgi:hypothetical protein